MRTLLTTTALVALFSMGAVAQDAAAPATGTGNDLLTQGYSVIDTDSLASRLIGFPVYTSAAADAEHLGEINDLVIGDDGNVAAVILGVGGFLGVGEKNVAIDYSQMEWTVAEDNTERLVLAVTREQLETAEAVDLMDDEMMDTAVAPANQPADAMDGTTDDGTNTAALPVDQPGDMDAADDATDTAAATPAEPLDDTVDADTETGAIGNQNATANDPMMDPLNRESLVDFDETALTAEDLIGINVYGPTDEHIGVIGDFVLGTDNGVDAVIIDFGGFLGIGTKQVAVAYEELDFYADENGDNRYLILNVTRDQMDQAPEFNRDTYAQERDAQRLVLDGDVAAN